MMFRRFLSPRYTIVALAVVLTLLLGDHLTLASTSDASSTTAPTASASSSPADGSPAPTAAASGADTATSVSDEETDGTDDDEPGEGSLDCSTDIMGDGQCDDSNNSEICGFDGGDCCECTCVATSSNICEGNFDCIDPDATCVSDDDGNGGTLVQDDDEPTDDESTGGEDDTGVNETDAASGLFASASFTGAAVGALAAVGLAFC